MALKLKLVRSPGYETYNSKEIKKDHTEETKSDKEATAEEEQEAPGPLVTHVNNILHSICSNGEVYINNQQIDKSNGLYVHKSYISINFMGTISEYKGVLHCEGYDYGEFPDEIMQAPLSESFSPGELTCLADLMASCCMVNSGWTFFSTSRLLYPNTKIWLRLIRARPNFK